MFSMAGCIRGTRSCWDSPPSRITDWRSASRVTGRVPACFVTLSLLLNLGVLAVFKYYNFFSEGLVSALTGLGFQADALLVRVILPAGLSFYTLKKLGYIIDVARENLEPTRDLIGFGLFAAFFPQITAGPIDRAQKLLPQIQSDRSLEGGEF